MTDLRETQRDAYGVLLAYLRDDLALLSELLGRYDLGERERALLLFAFSVALPDDRREELCETVYQQALAGAGDPNPGEPPANQEPHGDNTAAPPLASPPDDFDSEEPGERVARLLGPLEGRRLLRVVPTLDGVEFVFEQSGERGDRNLLTVYTDGERRLDLGFVVPSVYDLDFAL